MIIKKYKIKNKIKINLEKLLFSEFNFELTNKNTNLLSNIIINENKNLINITIENNKIENIDISDNLLFQDATLIETSLLLYFYNYSSLQDNLKKMPFHFNDLIDKIENKFAGLSKIYNEYLGVDFESILKDSKSIINGEFNYKKETKDFDYVKNDGTIINSLNTASGIKSFGLLQLLLQKGVLENRNLLIIDEPENHLHPKWQIEYAKLLIEIMKKGVKIIINTHSVYMIQAIKHFSQKEENKSLLNKVTFYLAEKQENGLSKIVDVSDDLNKVFKKLAEPLREIAWK